MSFKNHLFPVTGKCSVSQYFKKGEHSGIDIQTYGQHNDVMASNDGTVIKIFPKNVTKSGTGFKNYGTVIVIWHGNKQKTVYAHLVEGSPKVSEGQKVKRGQVIAQIDTFLHYEQRTGSKEQHPTKDSFKDPQTSPALIVDTSLTNKQTQSGLNGRGIDDHDKLNGLE